MRGIVMKRVALFAAAALALSGVPVLAQHSGHSSPAAKPAAENASTKAFRAANDKMHKDMNVPLTGDADVDFARSMIPHHQGAIDMAKIALQYGKDPEIRKLAEEVVSAQEAEIKFMRDWLAKRGAK
ncbi:MAG: DUF305 domain-containing protein [Beijerinckiaceae bacterium]|nr:DUF305 domain-containing protein [Beijerinckiaceae bacterium]